MRQAHGNQCVTKPKIWTKPNPKLFQYWIFWYRNRHFFLCQIFLIPNPILFWYRNRYFSNTETDTFSISIFSIPNPIPLKKLKTEMSHIGNANALLKHIRVEMVCAHPWSACFQTLSLGKYSWSKIQKPGLQTFSILLLSTPTQTVMNIIYKLKKSVVFKILVRFPTFPQSSPSPFIKF